MNLSVSGEELYDEAYKILEIVNAERKASGVSPLAMDATLMQGAMKRSAELSIYYSHTRPNGTSCFSIEEISQMKYYSVGENIAVNYSNATSVMNGWMNSPGHKSNILSSKFNTIGIGVFKHNGSLYFTQMFTDVKSTTPTKPSNKKVTRSINTLSNNIKISMNENDLAIKKGSSENLYVENLNQGWPHVYANLNNSNITWTSSNKNVAEVSKEGVVLAVGSGKTTIKATLSNGVSTSCKVVVEKDSTVPPEITVQPPSKVSNLHVDSRTSTSIKLDWNNVSNATKYAIYRATSRDGKYTRIASISSKNSYYTDKELKSATNYYYKVRAYKTVNDKNYYGSYSSIMKTTTSPAKVTNLHTDSKTKTSIKIDWNTVSRASGYAVYRSTSKEGTYKRVATVKSSYYSNKGLTKGKKYYYKVRAFKTVDGKNYYGSYSSVLSTYTSK